jgi:hypothetical protein
MPENSITISRFVTAYRRKLIALRIARVSLIAGALFFVSLAVLQIIFVLFPWTILPLVFDTAFLVAGLFILGYMIAAVTVRAPGLLPVARVIEQRSKVKTPLLAVSLELAHNDQTRDNPFTRQACSRAAADLAGCPQSPEPLRYAAPLGIAVLVLGLWCFLNHLSPRLLDYWDLPFSGLSRSGVTVSPGSVAVPMNACVDLRLVPKYAYAHLPSCRCIISTPDGERLSSMLLRPGPDGAFTCRLDSVKNTFLYRFAVSGAAIQTDTVTVVAPPRLLRLSVAVRPPFYTKRAERTLPEGQGNFEAYAGSLARVTIESNRLSAAWLVLQTASPASGTVRRGDSLKLDVKGPAASGVLRVDAPCNYTFALADTLGQKSDSLPVFHIGSIPDEPPSVQIVKPGFSRDLRPEQVETLAVEGVDDIGIRSLALKWRLGGERKNSAGEHDLSDPGAPPLISTLFVWHLAELSMYPGDTVFYWAEITDTKPSGSPQRGVSDTFAFRIPTFEEIHRLITEKESSVEKTMGAVRGKQEDLQGRLENIIKSMNGRKELSWEQKQILSDVKQSFEAQADSLRQSFQSLRDNIEKMKQEGSVGEELARKFDKVRSAVDELVRQYGDSLLFAMKDIEKPVSLREMRQAVEKVNVLLPRLSEQLDNVLKFLDMLKEDRKLAELALRAEQLSRLQAALSRSEIRDPAAAARQEELLGQIQQLSRDAKSRPEADSLRSRALVDSMQKAMRPMTGQSSMPSRETMNRMSGALLSLSQDLMQMMNFKEDMRMEHERDRLLSLSRDALMLAEWQDELLQEQRASPDPAAAARSQQALRDALGKSKEGADSLSMLPPEDMMAVGQGFRGAGGASEKVLEALGSGDGREAMAGSGTALRSLAGSLLAALSNIDNRQQSRCSGGACMMGGLRKLSGRQSAVNSMTAELLRRLLGGSQGQGMTSQRSAEGEGMEEAQKAQNAIADELKRLSEKYGKEAGEALGSRVGELEEEARRLAAAMRERPAADITERQDRFLARMLETTLSMHREGEGKDERKSRTAEKTFDQGPPAQPGTFFKDIDLFHRLRQRAFQGNFPDSYRSALRAYFDALSEKYLK